MKIEYSEKDEIKKRLNLRDVEQQLLICVTFNKLQNRQNQIHIWRLTLCSPGGGAHILLYHQQISPDTSDLRQF